MSERRIDVIRWEIIQTEMRLQALRTELVAALEREGRRPGDGSDQPELFGLTQVQPELFGG